MPDDYLDTTAPADVVWHLTSLSSLEHAARVVQDAAHPGRVLVVGADRAGFLLAVSRAFAANGIGVLDARLRTRSDGVAIDTFHVADDRTGDPLDDDRWGRVERDLLDALEGTRDLRPAVRARVDAYRRTMPIADVDVRPSTVGRFASIEVRMGDGIGVFSSIVEALHGEGLDIHLARVDTLAHRARDVFYVRRVGGGAIPASELSALGKRLADRLRS